MRQLRSQIPVWGTIVDVDVAAEILSDSDLKNAIHKINRGQIEVDLTHKGIDPMVHTIQRITKQLVAAFIMVALIVGSSLFIISEIPPLWKGVSSIGVIGILITLILGFGMLRDIMKKDYDNW